MQHQGPSVAFEHRCLLGESPVWSATEGALYWVDIHRPSILRGTLDNGEVREWPMPGNIGSIGLAARGSIGLAARRSIGPAAPGSIGPAMPGANGSAGRGLVAALRSGFASFDPATGALEHHADPLAGAEGIRFNDGRVDCRGRFWSATVSEKRIRGTASLHRFDPDGTSKRMLEGLTVGNGISWSPDNRTMYLADSWERAIYAFDFDADDGAISNRRVFAQFAEGEGIPDGATVDADGGYWSAHFDGGVITRFTPDGKRDRTIDMGVPRPTSCEFAGPSLRTLIVTSASFGLQDAQRAAAPQSGATFALDVGRQGLPEPVFGRAQRNGGPTA